MKNERLYNLTTLKVHYQDLWRRVAPHIETPTAKDVMWWTHYPQSIVEQAIRAAAARFGKGSAPSAAYRYTTAVARNITEEMKLTGAEIPQSPRPKNHSYSTQEVTRIDADLEYITI